MSSQMSSCYECIVLIDCWHRFYNRWYSFSHKSMTHTCFSFDSSCGAAGIKEACNGTSNTVCKEEVKGML